MHLNFIYALRRSAFHILYIQREFFKIERPVNISLKLLIQLRFKLKAKEKNLKEQNNSFSTMK